MKTRKTTLENLKKNKFIITVLVLIILFLFSFFFFLLSNKNVFWLDKDISINESMGVYNLNEEEVDYSKAIVPINIKVGKEKLDDKVLNKLATYNFDCSMLKLNNEAISWNFTGVKIIDVLNYFDIDGYNNVMFIAEDGYSTSLNKGEITDDIFIAFMQDNEFLNGEFHNKLVVPSSDSTKWVHNIERIEIS